ncbi:MAG: branched-chain amino acid ABC transporter permease [Acidimicrobiales bacterium]
MTAIAPSRGWPVALAGAVAVPFVLSTPFFLRTATVALVFVALAVAYDLVVGRVGALSLAQPVFYAFGAYAAAILAVKGGNPGVWVELLVAVVGAIALALFIGIPSFRLSQYTFAIGTLGFALIAQLVALNWVGMTGGPLCISPVPGIEVPLGTSRIVVAQGVGYYWIALGLAAATVAGIHLLSRSRTGGAITAVRDDPVLAAARGLWPLRLRLLVFGIAAGVSAVAGVFTAHFQRVVCPTQVEFPTTILLLIMVFLGGRASLRGVTAAALVFSIVPQVLRITNEWRMVIFGLLLLVAVTSFPDGIEHIYAALDRRRKRRATAGAAADRT